MGVLSMSEYNDFFTNAFFALIFMTGAYIWILGLIGMFRTNSIKKTYGGVISSGWALLRFVRILCNGILIAVIVGNMGRRLIGYSLPVRLDNVIGSILIVLLNVLFYRSDQTRFYQYCDKKEAKKMIRAERQLGCSVITRFSLIFSIFSLTTLFVLTDTSEYVRDSDGTIYRIKNDGFGL